MRDTSICVDDESLVSKSKLGSVKPHMLQATNHVICGGWLCQQCFRIVSYFR